MCKLDITDNQYWLMIWLTVILAVLTIVIYSEYCVTSVRITAIKSGLVERPDLQVTIVDHHWVKP